ncbi:hypothetical protein OH76DRAFT_1410756 [Lentinus brumalis]|uniref:HNH nuclease domain-containing protein n=1 Tax=Lentinus brumalis TaxID=2498619 RepID=A0A371CRG9_9APHY|nr:hypothetical protein OH76DRAFT_1410756 [Polyporus brumalis]
MSQDTDTLGSPLLGDLTEIESSQTHEFSKSLSDSTLYKQIFTSLESTEYLGRKAREYIKVLDIPAYKEYNRPQWMRRLTQDDGTDFTIKKVFEAFFDGAEQVGLQEGLRYAYAATWTCLGFAKQGNLSEEGSMEVLAKELSRLGTAWVAFMLWPFAPSNSNLPDVADSPLSESATPTFENTGFQIDAGVETRQDWRNNVLKRDKHTCPLTGFVSPTMPLDMRPPGAEVLDLEVAHVVDFSAIDYNAAKDKASKTRSITMTLGMVRSYVGGMEGDKFWAGLQQLLRGTENALLLERYMHRAFDNFAWCLVEIAPNTYNVKWFDRSTVPSFFDIAEQVTFTDCSGESPGFAVPSALLLRWHAALAHVFHLSGAAGLFTNLHHPPGSNGPAVLSKSGADFMEHVVNYDGEAICQLAELTESVAAVVLG